MREFMKNIYIWGGSGYLNIFGFNYGSMGEDTTVWAELRKDHF